MSDVRTFPLIIDGADTDAEGGATLDVPSPHTGDLIARIAAATPADVDRAVDAARRALPGWRSTPPLERGAAIARFARLFDDEAEELARLVHEEMGKPLAEAQAEVARAAEVNHHYAAEAERLWETYLPGGGSFGVGNHVRGESIGVVASITPWNFPVALIVWKLAPALAAGCTLVVKTAQEAPLSAWRVCDIARRSGLPEGVVNCVSGDGPALGEALATHEGVDKVAFTGSRRVAELIAGWAAPRLKAISLELGGHGPLLVLDDADLGAAVDVATVQGFANAGQACYSVNRVLVPRAREGEFLDAFRARVAALELGPMATERGFDRHHELMDDARAKGATVEGGGTVEGRRLAPAIVTGAGPGVRVVDEEPFTPVVTVMPYDDLDAAIAEANRPDYGLVGYVCGGDLRRTMDVARRIECGTVVVNGSRVVVANAPYAGWKGSGVGAELGHPGLEAFIRWQHVRVLA